MARTPPSVPRNSTPFNVTAEWNVTGREKFFQDVAAKETAQPSPAIQSTKIRKNGILQEFTCKNYQNPFYKNGGKFFFIPGLQSFLRGAPMRRASGTSSPSARPAPRSTR